MSVTEAPAEAPAPAPKAEFITLPNIVRVILGIIVSVAAVLNVTTFHWAGNAAAYVSAGLAFAAYVGVPPVTGNAFQDLLLQILPASTVQTAHVIIGAGIGAVTVVVAHANWSTAVTAIVLGVVSALGALGFGPVGTDPVTPPAPQSALGRLPAWAKSKSVHRRPR